MKVLGQTSGENVPPTTKRVLKNLVTDEVAVLYSWTGRKGKKRAEKLKIISLVFGEFSFFLQACTFYCFVMTHFINSFAVEN